jgi:hypothetical protein
MLPLELLDRLAAPIPPPTDSTDRGQVRLVFRNTQPFGAMRWCSGFRLLESRFAIRC